MFLHVAEVSMGGCGANINMSHAKLGSSIFCLSQLFIKLGQLSCLLLDCLFQQKYLLFHLPTFRGLMPEPKEATLKCLL